MKTSYALSLRAIGQDLEMRDLKAFDLEIKGNEYRVRGWYGATSSPAPVELCYTHKDIEYLEREGRAKRHDCSGMPDLLSLAGILRGVGAYVDQKDARLLGVSRREESVRIRYVTEGGDHREEKHLVSSIYEICVNMFKQRGKTPKSYRQAPWRFTR